VDITSLTNQFVTMLVTLHSRKGRDATGMFLAEGRRTCESLLSSPLKLEKLIVTKELMPLALNFRSRDDMVVVSEQIMKKISTVTTPSGMVGLFHIPPEPSLEHLSSGVVCARIMDPGNAGTLIRTAVAFGYPSVVFVDGVDPWNSKVVQASAGALGNVTIFSTTWDALRTFTQGRYLLSALVVRGGEDLNALTYPSHHLFVVGGEAQGIPDAWIASCDRRVTVPMPGNAESLNAAVAGSLALAVGYWRREV
jgi:TrmH family RNA methyltransferase